MIVLLACATRERRPCRVSESLSLRRVTHAMAAANYDVQSHRDTTYLMSCTSVFTSRRGD
eukprot:1192669-Prorocentrum_minimum.AAC.2